MKKYSKQRQLMIESLQTRKDHPTAEQLHIDLKEQMPEIGIATVYRNLTQLCEEGMIKKVKSSTGPDRYDGNQKPHIHFECKNCHQIMDIYLEEEQKEQFEGIENQISHEREIKLEESEIYLMGLCKECQNKK